MFSKFSYFLRLILFIILYLTILFLIGCKASKQEIYDKCLYQANQTFSNDLEKKSQFFYNCMKENDFRFICGSGDPIGEKLSSICYNPSIAINPK